MPPTNVATVPVIASPTQTPVAGVASTPGGPADPFVAAERTQSWEAEERLLREMGWSLDLGDDDDDDEGGLTEAEIAQFNLKTGHRVEGAEIVCFAGNGWDAAEGADINVGSLTDAEIAQFKHRARKLSQIEQKQQTPPPAGQAAAAAVAAVAAAATAAPPGWMINAEPQHTVGGTRGVGGLTDSSDDDN